MISLYQKVAVAIFGAVVSLLTVEASPSLAYTYDEAVKGDLPSDVSDSPVFVLGLGVNTFTGELTFGASFGEDDPFPDFDSFRFEVPIGTSLQSILLDISLLPGDSAFNQIGYDLENSLGTAISSKRIRIPSANRKLFRADLPLSSGQYALRDAVHSGSLLPYDFETAEYTFSLNVVSAKDISSVDVAAAEEIPEASNLAGLICLGLGGLLLKLTKTRGRKMRSQM